MQEPVPEDEVARTEAATSARQLELLEYRLRAVAGSVTQVLDAVLPTAPAPTYGRHGRVG